LAAVTQLHDGIADALHFLTDCHLQTEVEVLVV
jgi:hypothetical protein